MMEQPVKTSSSYLAEGDGFCPKLSGCHWLGIKTSIFLQFFLCACDAALLIRGQTSTFSKFPLALCECMSECLQQDLGLIFPRMLEF